MKKYILIATIIASVFFIITVIAYFNLSISLTYEIDEPKLIFKDRALDIEEKGKYLRELIVWIKCFAIYSFVNILINVIILFKLHKSVENK